MKQPLHSRVLILMLVSCLCALSAWIPDALAQDPPSQDLFDALEKTYEGYFDDREAELDALWNRMEAEEEAKWKRLEQEVLQKWDIYAQTSKKIWVDYSDERDAVSQVNFETGKVVVEAVVPKSAEDPVKEGKQLIAKQVNEMVQKQAPDGKPVMENMLSGDQIQSVVEEEPKKPVYEDTPVIEKDKPPIKTEVAVAVKEAELVVETKPVLGKDGVERIKVRVELTMVPDHVKRRAERYTSLVEENAQKRNVEPALAMAIIHTESSFNPMARSPIPAFGLMQLVPRFAAKEAYQQIYGKEKVLSAEYLYDPKNNIELGVTYFARLEQNYFNEIKDPVKRRYIAICAYNWGPTAMRKKVVGNLQIDAMTPEELYGTLQKRVPDETKNYLKRVEERRGLYRQ